MFKKSSIFSLLLDLRIWAKLFLGFAALLAVMVAMGAVASKRLGQAGDGIDWTIHT